jgi:hypothetical protein
MRTQVVAIGESRAFLPLDAVHQTKRQRLSDFLAITEAAFDAPSPHFALGLCISISTFTFAQQQANADASSA